MLRSFLHAFIRRTQLMMNICVISLLLSVSRKRDTVTEEPISPEFRLATALYRLSRGDYYYTIAEMTGLGVSTVCTIVNEVTRAIVDNVWDECVGQQLPKSKEQFKKKIVDMEEQ